MNQEYILVDNPGSASRKYAVYKSTGSQSKPLCLANIHFETSSEGQVIYSLSALGNTIVNEQPAGLSHIAFSITKLRSLLEKHQILKTDDVIKNIGLRIVAPSSFFQQHHKVNKQLVDNLKALQSRAPLHINSTLQELELLEKEYPKADIFGVSDSQFHHTLPDYARTYGISQSDAKQSDVWRFGYHGLSLSSVVQQLKKEDLLKPRVVVCHLGSGSSVSALHNGVSIDTTMGYSPNEGLVMATRSGSIDQVAFNILSKDLGLSANKKEEYLNYKSGLLAISGKSSDIRKLLELEAREDTAARLALKIFTYHVQLAIGQMTAALGGIDALVFTGTIGERSSEMRKRIVSKLEYLGCQIDSSKNAHAELTKGPVAINEPKSLPIYLVQSEESDEIVRAIQLN